MVGQINRRRVKKRKKPSEGPKQKIILVAGILALAVLLGYLTARFVIGPLLGYNADESPIKIAEEEGQKSQEAEDKAKETEAEAGSDTQNDAGSEEGQTASDIEGTQVSATPDDGYALQFGVFSSKEAADKLVATLAEKGIQAKIIEADGSYKVISQVVDTKDKALSELESAKEKEVSDVFIASF